MKALVKPLLLLTILATAVLVVMIGQSQLDNKVELSFINGSGKFIETLDINLRGRKCDAIKMVLNSEIRCTFMKVSDSSYDVFITFQDGEELVQKNIGYVTHGKNYIDRITLTKENQIELESKIEFEKDI